MNTRRQFALQMFRMVIGVALSVTPASALFSRAFAAVKRRVLPRGTDLQTLKNENPAALDTRNLDIMPLEKFETMGPTSHEESLDRYRFEVGGKVRQNLSLSYSELLSLPAVEENVLLICPGIFTIHARWKGIAVHELLKMAGSQEEVTHVSVHGPRGPYEKVESFNLAEVQAGKVFLAYAVNGQTLPQKHGFPLRVVAPDRFGSDWVKYVYKIEAR
jgi:DMSO/TMAO reductase YedYZ molybdopterin-dependent catalytic subunit